MRPFSLKKCNQNILFTGKPKARALMTLPLDQPTSLVALIKKNIVQQH